MRIMAAAVTTAADPQVSYHSARLWALGATVLLAIIASGFLIPLKNRRTARRLSRALDEQKGPTWRRLSRGTPDQQHAKTAKAQARLRGAQVRARTPFLGVLLGRDHRLSTSTTIAYLWTLVIVWIILALVIAWPPDWATALNNLYPSYILLLGGPYAAWVLARVAVSTKVANQTLQKPPGDGSARLSDLVSGDNGNPDLFDMQYVIFNGAAMAFVVAAFVHASAEGFTHIPWSLLFLTGGPAAVFVGNKALAGNAPAIFSVAPTTVTVGGTITVYGQNFLAANAVPPTTPGSSTVGADAAASGTGSTPAKVSVLLGGNDTDVIESYDGVVRATVMAATYPADPLDITVISSSGANAVLRAEVRVLPQLTFTGLNVSTVKQEGSVTITGTWSDPSLAPLTLAVDNSIAVAPSSAPRPTNQQATFVIPNLGLGPGKPSKTVTLLISQGGQTASVGNLVVSA